MKQQVGKDQPAYTKNIILETIGDRTDEEAVAIKRRLLTCSDLPAVDARYHIVCRKKLDREFLHFQRDKSPTFSATKQRGRPKNDFQIKNFNALCQLLEEDCDLYSVAELHEKMRLLSDDPNDSSQIFSSKQYLKKKLKEKYADEILFTDHANKSDVVFFKWNANRIINDTWYNQRIANAEDESTRIIKTAAKLIQMQLRSTDYDIISYPSTEIIGDLKSNKEWMPPLLQVFMECLVKDELKQASIGQTLVHAARPKSSIPPIMFGTAINCDHMFGSKWLLTILNRLGFCLSPDEIIKYKQSVVENENINDVLQTIAAGSFSQWSADNVDHNVKTIDGKGSLHGMGIVLSTTGGVSQGPLPQIPRQKRVNANEVVKNKSIPLLDYLPSDRNSISNLKLLKLKELQAPVDLSPDTYTDLLWHAKYFHRTDVPRPAWNGYMQDISKGTFPGQSVINMLPIIDLDPTNIKCIFSTPLFITEQATKLGINTPVVTFDQPLWLKATEIITDKSMSMVLLLGGFHMLMSFMGSIGTIMENSGLSTVLETIYGSVSVKHMLTGKAIAMSLRGNFIVESALMAHLL